LPAEITVLISSFIRVRELSEGDFVFKKYVSLFAKGDDEQWTPQNFRHTTGNYLVTSKAPSVVLESFAVAMHTSTACLVGISSKKRQIGGGKAAYSNGATATRDAELANDVLKAARHEPIEGWYLVPIHKEMSICKVLAVNYEQVTCTLLVFDINFDDESRVYLIAPETSDACILIVPQATATRYPVRGINQPNYVPSKARYAWLRISGVKALFEDASSMFNFSSCLFRPKPQNRVPLQPGQFGICRGELVEVRAVSGVSVTIIPYTLRDKEWRLSSDAYCVEISSKAINVVLDWSFTSSGGIVVSHQG